MKFGVMQHSTDLSMSPVLLAQEAEARGYDSIYLPEHTHIPTSRRSPPPTGDDELPEPYFRTMDPYVVLAAIAQATSRIRLGTGVALPAQHDPITLAKSIATLDHLSDGRVTWGMGYGWNREELENHGIDPKTRRARVREYVLAMRELWSKEVAEYHGDFVKMEPSWCWPKPVQQPGPPIVVGAAPGPITFAHIAEFADGWIPIGGAGVRQAIPALRAEFEKRDRDPESLQIITFGVNPDPGKLDYYREIGVTEIVFRLPAGAREDEVMPILDTYTKTFLET